MTLEAERTFPIISPLIAPLGYHDHWHSWWPAGSFTLAQLDNVLPDPEAQVESQQWQQKELHDQHARICKFRINDQDYAHNIHSGEASLAVYILKTSGPASFIVQLSDGCEWTRHQGHIRKGLDTSAEVTGISEKSSLSQGLSTEEDMRCKQTQNLLLHHFLIWLCQEA